MPRQYLFIIVEILVDAGMGIFVGSFAYRMTQSSGTAIVSGIVSAALTYLACRLATWLFRFRLHKELLDSLIPRLTPPRLCPVVYDEAKEEILKVVDTIATTRFNSIKSAGLMVNWIGYSRFLQSSLSFSESAFMATCLLSPVQFMDERFRHYLIAQDRKLRGSLWMIPWQRFRIMAVDRDEILAFRLDEHKKKLIGEFFDWHAKRNIPLFFITRKKFQELHQKGFHTIKINDFVFFNVDGYVWVIGTQTDYTKPPQIEDQTHLWANDDDQIVRQHKEFLFALKRAGKRVKQPDALFKWCTEDDHA